MALKGVNDGYRNPLERSGLRTSWTQPEGGAPAYIHEARVINVNLVNWTVDVRTQFDNRFFPDVQVASPYLHANRGAGIYAMPEINTKCQICIPSDGPPPFVLAFIMPTESVDDVTGQEDENNPSVSTFRGGRPRAKMGDIFMRGHDGQFVILHRGGVLQVGSTELAQRLYIPLGNIITDISQNYEHHNTGGTINWGITSSSTDENPKTQYFQTFRVNANDTKADIRVAFGTVHQPVTEPPGDAGEFDQNVAFGLGQGEDNPIVCELIVAPQGFIAESGSPDSAEKITKLKFTFDKSGNSFFRTEGNLNIRVKKKIRLAVDEDASLVVKGGLSLHSDKKLRLEGNSGIDITSSDGVLTFQGGDAPVAAVGSIVDVVITLPIPITTSAGPGTIVPGPNARLTGFIVSGSKTILVPKPG